MSKEPFFLSRDDIGRLTYREAWEWFVEPAIEDRKQLDRETGHVPIKRHAGGFDSSAATEAESSALFDRICGDRVYKGPKFWIPGEVPGVKSYNGPGKE